MSQNIQSLSDSPLAKGSVQKFVCPSSYRYRGVQQSESEGTHLSHPTAKASNFSEPYHHSVTRQHVAVLQYKDNFTFIMVS